MSQNKEHLDITRTPIAPGESLIVGRRIGGKIIFSFKSMDTDFHGIMARIESYSKGYKPVFHIPVKYDAKYEHYTPIYPYDFERSLHFFTKREATDFARKHKIRQKLIDRVGNRFGSYWGIFVSENRLQNPRIFEKAFFQ